MTLKQDWEAAAVSLDAQGWALLPKLLDAKSCARLRGLYDKEIFRSTVVMARHGFGRGEYKYFSYPLPDAIADLREALYAKLAPVANRWAAARNEDVPSPAAHGDYLKRCHQAGQRRPTPLLLKYGPGDYNCLHQDLYGELVFPLQLTVLLSEPKEDFTGGEFLIVEQRPRAQSRGEVVPLQQGEAVIFPVHHRPVEGARGPYRATMRHGVSRLHSGQRYTLGIIFHDAA